MFIVTLSVSQQTQNQPVCPSADDGERKRVSVQSALLPSHRQGNPICSKVGQGDTTSSEVHQTQKDTHFVTGKFKKLEQKTEC